MPYLCCTAKVLREIGTKPPKPETYDAPGPLGDWHVNLFLFDRRKCLIFVNDRTLLSMIVTGVSRDRIRRLDECFREALGAMLASELLPAAVIDRLMAEYTEIAIAPTHDRSVLGSMNDLVYHYTHTLAREGGVLHADAVALARRNNRMPVLSRPFECGIDALNGVLADVAPGVEVDWSYTRMLTRLKELLAGDRGREIVLTYDEVVPTFHSIPRFMQECERNGLECFFPPITTPGVFPLRMHVRLHSIMTRLGLDLPGKE